VLQYKVTDSMKQDSVPEKLKEAIKLRTVLLQARVPKSVMRFTDADAPLSDEESVTDDTSLPLQEDNGIDSAVDDYPLPPMTNSPHIPDDIPMLDVKCPFVYRALHE
jgi:hypothetical protein